MSDTPISAREHEWQLDVVQKLATLIERTEDLTKQVQKQNGNVARLWAEMDAVKRHPAECPLGGRVALVETALLTEKASKTAVTQATATWIKWLDRIAYAVLVIVGILVLKNGPEILKIIAH